MKILSLVSVPLRGYGFEISEQIQRLKALMEVSVPLRGYGFEIMDAWMSYWDNLEEFPSPCGDMVLKCENEF